MTLYRADAEYQFYRGINYIAGLEQSITRQVAASSQVVLKEWPARCPIPGPGSCNLSESLLWGNNINLAINNGRLSDGSYHCDLNEDWRRHMIKLLSKWGVQQQVIWWCQCKLCSRSYGNVRGDVNDRKEPGCSNLLNEPRHTMLIWRTGGSSLLDTLFLCPLDFETYRWCYSPAHRW